MSDWINFEKDPKHVAREKAKARELRKTQWWKNEINKGICYYCKKKCPVEELTMDHIVPIARGGKSTRGNVAPCCKTCNVEKKYYTPVDILLKNLKKDEGDS